MKIERGLLLRQTIEQFADSNSLVMVVVERSPISSPGLPKFLACFDKTEIRDAHVLKGEYGNGETEEKAIADYAKRISEKCLVVDAYRESRRSIIVPLLVPAAE